MLRIPGKAPAAPRETRELPRSEPMRAEPARVEPTRAEPTRAEPARAEPSRTESARVEPPRAESARVEPADPAPAVVATAPPTLPTEPTAGERAMSNAEAAERSGDLERAHAEYLKAAQYRQSGAAGKAEQLGKQLVTRYSLRARTAFAKQDLDGAIREWDRVLGIDPGNETAKFERQRAVMLKDKVKKL